MILLTGGAGFYVLFLRTWTFIKIIPIILFLNCFLSNTPYVSFNAYVSVVACVYYFVAYTHLDDFEPTFNILKVLLLLNVFILLMQILGIDNLLNFGRATVCFGIVGQHMQMGSFSVILAVALSVISNWFYVFPILIGLYCSSAWALLCGMIGLSGILWAYPLCTKILKLRIIIFIFIIFIGYAAFNNKFTAAMSQDSGRLIVWKKTVELTNKRPLTGWGIGTYKVIFPALSGLKSVPWRTAHNDFLQLLFEFGYPLFIVFIICWIKLFFLIRLNASQMLTGFILITLDMMVHFPTRILNCVPIILFFFAYHSVKRN